MAGRAGEAVVSALKFEIGGADAGGQQTNSGEFIRHTRQRLVTDLHPTGFQMNSKHRLKLRDMASATQTVAAELVCFNEKCRARYAITEVLYNCPQCGGLVEATY